jgi:phage terminase large subunit
MLKLWVLNRAKTDPETGDKSVVSILNGGGSRAGKTFDIVHLLVTIMRAYADPKSKYPKRLYIAVYRDTLVNARKRTFEDFTKCMRIMGLEEGKDFTTTNSATVKIEMLGHTIEFMGIPPENQQPVGCDIAFINELIENNNYASFVGIKRRTEILLLADWNPKESIHWAYDIKRFNTFYTRTTYLDNKHLPDGQKAEAESQCPWDFSDSELYLEAYDDFNNMSNLPLPKDFSIDKWKKGEYQFDGFLRRRWLKEERPEICNESDYHLYRAVNQKNKEEGSINRSDWYTYGEGIPCAQEGAVFKDVEFVEEFPEIMEEVHLGLDYGYTNDFSCLTRVGIKSGMDMYIECHTYQPTPNPEILWDLIVPQVEIEIERRKREAKGQEISDVIIMCESSDLFKDGTGFYRFTDDMNMLSMKYGKMWQFTKVEKPNIVPRVGAMKKFKLNLVVPKDESKGVYRYEMGQRLLREQQNYVYLKKEDGKSNSNMPDPKSKWNHAWDSAGYCVWGLFSWRINS